MPTSENLMEAFAGESQANRKYLAFAKKAQDDGLPQVAKLFRAAVDAETVHAHAHLRVMGGIKSTPENLQEAIEGEGHEFKNMYPGFLAEAEKEGNKPAVFSFKNALAVELYICEMILFNSGSRFCGLDLHNFFQSLILCTFAIFFAFSTSL